MAERGEGFWGIAGAIRCENRVRAANMAQRRWEKRPVNRISVRPKGNFTLKPGFVLGVFLGRTLTMFDVGCGYQGFA
jgi:hypothetical protein